MAYIIVIIIVLSISKSAPNFLVVNRCVAKRCQEQSWETMAKQLLVVYTLSVINPYKLRTQIPDAAQTAQSLTLQVTIRAGEGPRRFTGWSHYIKTWYYRRQYGKIIYSATDKSRSRATFRRICWIWLTMNSVLRKLSFSSQTAKMWLYYQSSHSPHMDGPSFSESYENCRWQQPSRN